MGTIPEGDVSFGDVYEATRILTIKELILAMEALKHVNAWLTHEETRFNHYAQLNG